MILYILGVVNVNLLLCFSFAGFSFLYLALNVFCVVPIPNFMFIFFVFLVFVTPVKVYTAIADPPSPLSLTVLSLTKSQPIIPRYPKYGGNMRCQTNCIETEAPIGEVVMVETQTPVVSDVSDTKQLHTQPQKMIAKGMRTYMHNSTIFFPCHWPLVSRVA